MNRSPGALGKHHSTERTEDHNEKRWGAPCGQQYESYEGERKIWAIAQSWTHKRL